MVARKQGLESEILRFTYESSHFSEEDWMPFLTWASFKEQSICGNKTKNQAKEKDGTMKINGTHMAQFYCSLFPAHEPTRTLKDAFSFLINVLY